MYKTGHGQADARFKYSNYIDVVEYLLESHNKEYSQNSKHYHTVKIKLFSPMPMAYTYSSVVTQYARA